MRTATALPLSSDRPRRRRLDAEQRQADIGAAGADQPGEAQHLAATHIEADVLEDALAAEPVDTDSSTSPGVAGGARLKQSPISRPTMSAISASAASSRPRGRVEIVPAVAEHRHPVGDLEDLLQAVADEQDRRRPGRAGRATCRNSCAAPRGPTATRSARP